MFPRRLAPLAVLGVLLGGAAVLAGPDAAPPTGPPDGMGLVYVLRPTTRSSSVEVAIYVGESLMGACAGKQYLAFSAPPGRHHVQAKGPKGEGRLALLVEEGSTSYVEQSFKGDGGIELALLTASEGKDALEDLAFVAGKSEAPAPVDIPVPAAPTSAAAASSAPPPPEKATVVVFRPGKFRGGALNTSVYIDGVEVADLDNGTYIKAALAPGKHRFHSDDDEDEFELDLAPGQVVYITIFIRSGMWKGHGEMRVLEGTRGTEAFEDEVKDDIEYAKDIRDASLLVRD